MVPMLFGIKFIAELPSQHRSESSAMVPMLFGIKFIAALPSQRGSEG
jgi:hypothetical protein